MKKIVLMILPLIFVMVMSDVAFAEEHDEEPMFHRSAMWYFSTIRVRKDYWEDSFHAGAIAGWTNKLYWRDWFMADNELNLKLGGFIQFKGFRFEGYGNWTDPFDKYDMETPIYWDLNASYLFIIENAQLLIGLRRNNFQGLVNHDTEYGLPNFLDEIFIKVMSYPKKIQKSQQGSNISYFACVHQRIYGNNGNLDSSINHDDGTLVDIGIQTISQNAWQFADVISFTGAITWNQRFLSPYGRFGSYRFGLRFLKDVSDVTNPGYGPMFFQLNVLWLDSFEEGKDQEFIISISFILTTM